MDGASAGRTPHAPTGKLPTFVTQSAALTQRARRLIIYSQEEQVLCGFFREPHDDCSALNLIGRAEEISLWLNHSAPV